MSEEETVDIDQELDDLLTKVQPNLQDVIKRVNKLNFCEVFIWCFYSGAISYWFIVEFYERGLAADEKWWTN